jgi:hypothetical protein
MEAEVRESVRVAVYDSFRRLARAPSVNDLVSTLAVDAGTVRQALGELSASRHLVYDHAVERIVMAHPFSSVPLGFSVMGQANIWWGGCAWDSFALPHLIPEEPRVLVATTCPGCRTALAWTVDRLEPPEGGQVAHFLTPAAHMWDNVVHTCGHQRLFCSEACVEHWLASAGRERGYTMDLPTLWRLAQGWYTGRLEHGYKRRELAAAKDYLLAAGLHGPFWGLPE